MSSQWPARTAVTATCLTLALRVLSGADYVGAAVCAECHKANYERQSVSHHAHSLRKIEGTAAGTTLLREGHSPDGRLRYEQDASGVVVHEDGVEQRAVLEWAFGAGAQGSTPVGHFGEQYFEHRFSYYARIPGLAPTFGHPRHASTPIAELGVLQDSRTITRCFNCHATGVQQGAGGPDLSGMLPGVQCERCHGPGSAHIQAAKQREPRERVLREIVNPGRFNAKAQLEICGQCHRLATPGSGDEPELEDPVTVRFAPISLAASRCFRSSGKLSCVTCHDPHEDARPRTEFAYSEKCLACHASGGKPVKLCGRERKDNCLPCHMKEAALGAYLRFTDHRIRVP